MRFNSKELACLARQSSDHFDKEGVLFVKERQDSLFRKTEVYVERLFRLRGNLLFYFKSKDVASEIVGVIVLERCLVQLDDDDQSLFSFIIVFEGEERDLRLATRNEEERDGWIERLHIAGYECLRIQLESLREQLKTRTGRDPIESGGLALDNAVSDNDAGATASQQLENEPVYEMSLACHGLPDDSSGHAPDTYAVVHYQVAFDQPWVPYTHTEIVERNASPMYLTTVSFSSQISTATRLRVTVYCVKERLTNTMAHIGYAIFTLSNVLTAVNNSIILRLNSLDSHDVGSLAVTASENTLIPSPSGTSEPAKLLSSSSLEGNRVTRSKSLASEYRHRSFEALRADYENIYMKSFRFPVGSSSDHHLIVQEYMGESRLTYLLPIQLLKLFADEERNKIEQLEQISGLSDGNDQLRQQVMDFHCSALTHYVQHSDYLSGFEGKYFKPSTKKNHKEVEFAPTNLHIQRMLVCHSATENSVFYDITTVGVFTASSQKYKHGGLRKMMQQLDQRTVQSSNDFPPSNGDITSVLGHTTSIARLASRLMVLQKSTDSACDSVCAAAVLGDTAAIDKANCNLTEKVRELIEVCEENIVSKGVSAVSAARPVNSSPSSRGSATNSHLDVPWKWSGTDFIKSPNEEPWDMTKLNTQAALMCVTSKVEELTQQQSERASQWLDNISPLIIKLKRCIEVMCSRANNGLAFLAVQECAGNMTLIHAFSYRRDIVFSQAVTAVTSAFITKLSSCASDTLFIEQIMNIGMLIQFESLITCYGDELFMLEDMDVGMSDVANVRFRIEKVKAGNFTEVQVSGQRFQYTITVMVTSEVFNLLPSELREGQTLEIVPVMFTIGINEQASLAEKIGDVSLQENINRRNYGLLYAYYEKFVGFQTQHCATMKRNELQSLDDLMRHLSVNVESKKSKNVEVLHMADEVCVAMKGARLTGCKSAKDRTAMAVTLEQVRHLQREHDLASDVFLHALECFRSEGVRRENTRKNTGTAKYAFNSIQLLYLPKLYRPPAGTYANVET